MLRQDCENWACWPSNRPVVIAEVGLNHGGDEKLAWEMIQVAHENGADFIKLQTYSTEQFFHPSLPYFDSIKSMELSPKATSRLFEKAKAIGAHLITTPFDFNNLELIEALAPPLYKVASMDNNNFPLIRRIAEKRRPMIVSCGMASIQQIRKLVEEIKKTGNEQLILLHCISDYPAELTSLNLEMIPYLRKLFNVPVGFSDHSIGMHGAYLAASLGAVAIEKHFTIDRKLSIKFPDADHEISFEPNELMDLRAFCENVPIMRGEAPRDITKGEVEGEKALRRGIYAKRAIKVGEPLTLENTVFLRPVDGISVGFWDKVNHKKALRAMDAMEPVCFSDIGLKKQI